MKPIRIMLADDHTLVRDGVRSLLEHIDGIEIVAEANDGLEILKLLKTIQTDLVLMDVAMPQMNGLQATAHLHKRYPDIRILILSSYANEEYVLKALSSGAKGYLLKDTNVTELELAIKTVAQGETYLTPIISKQAIDDYLQRSTSVARPTELLTPRQQDVLQLIAEGNSNKKIARILCISAKTVESHRTQLMKQLDIHDVTGLVRYAIRMGLTTSNKI